MRIDIPSYISASIAGRWEFSTRVYIRSRQLCSGLMSRRRNRDQARAYHRDLSGATTDRQSIRCPLRFAYHLLSHFGVVGFHGRVLASRDLRHRSGRSPLRLCAYPGDPNDDPHQNNGNHVAICRLVLSCDRL